jgi:hypothetical protein
MDMKKIKKHVFTHRDPETQTVAPEKISSLGAETTQKDELAVIKKDFRKTVLVILAFVIIIVAFYFIQTKTSLLKPVLRIFGL